MTDEGIFSRDRLGGNDALAAWYEAPCSRPESLIQDTSVFNFGQIENSIGLDLYLLGIERGKENVGGFFGEGFGGEAVEGAGPVDLIFLRIL